MDVSEVASSGSGTVCGMIIGQVSPIKSSKKWADMMNKIKISGKSFFDRKSTYFELLSKERWWNTMYRELQ